jgi:hypothetical protein
MIGYTLTPEQKDLIQGQYFVTDIFFNCVIDINGVWFLFLSEQDIPLVQASQYAWVLTLPQGEYIPKPTPFPFDETN